MESTVTIPLEQYEQLIEIKRKVKTHAAYCDERYGCCYYFLTKDETINLLVSKLARVSSDYEQLKRAEMERSENPKRWWKL